MEPVIARCRSPWRLVLPLLSLIALASSALAQERGAPFTPEERSRLLAGELVRRPDARREGNGRYIGGTSWQRVRAPREEVWRVIEDVRNYPRLIPGVDTARVVEDRGDERVIFLRHSYSFVHASYYARVRIQRDDHTIRFDLDRSRPHDIRDGRGFITLDRYGDDETIVTWGVMADVGSGILTGVFAPVIHDWILRVPWCVRGRIEPGQGTC